MKVDESVISAGFGGQGVIVLGKFLATCGMQDGYNVTWLPSYGVEVRGGTAFSSVRISTQRVGSPVVESPSTAIIMNEPSLDRFEPCIQKKGLLVLNTSMITRAVKRRDLNVVEAPLTDMASGIGNMKVANIVAAGIYWALRGFLSRETIFNVLRTMSAGNTKLFDDNKKAIELGFDFGSKLL